MLQGKQANDDDEVKGGAVYSQNQMDQIQEQLKFICSEKDLNEDEEFKLAESLAFDLSQGSQVERMNQTQQEFADALQRSYKQLKDIDG